MFDALLVEVVNTDVRSSEIKKNVVIDSRKPKSLTRNDDLKQLLEKFKRKNAEEFIDSLVKFF